MTGRRLLLIAGLVAVAALVYVGRVIFGSVVRYTDAYKALEVGHRAAARGGNGIQLARGR